MGWPHGQAGICLARQLGEAAAGRPRLMPVFAAVRNVAPVAQPRTVVESAVVVDAGSADRGSERRRDPHRLPDVDVVPIAAARGRAVVDEPPAARVMVPGVGLLPPAVPVRPLCGQLAGGDEVNA